MTASGPAIAKTALSDGDYRRTTVPFPSARAAFRAFLERTCAAKKKRVLLPAYVGWSQREGSGVLDPVTELGLPVSFYRVDSSLRADLAHLEELLGRGDAGAVTLIHYFGYREPASAEVARLARAHGALVLEDEAHAMLTDLVGGACGRLGDACIYSLHKMLPLRTGGALVVNPRAPSVLTGEPFAPTAGVGSPWEFDLARLASVRRRNARTLERLLAPLAGRVDLFRPWADDEVPQTFPVLIRRAQRDRLYEQMNAAGFGVVTLYHTMVAAISREEFPVSHELARTILNLPVHHEADEEGLARLVAELDRLTG